MLKLETFTKQYNFNVGNTGKIILLTNLFDIISNNLTDFFIS